MTEHIVQRVGAKVVLEAEGAILAMHPSEIDLNRNWQIPGGIRDDITEAITQTAMRELVEETGVVLPQPISPDWLFKYGEWPAVDKEEKVKIMALFFHVVLPERPEIVLSEEHDDYAWLDLGNYKDYPANQEVYEIVERLFK